MSDRLYQQALADPAGNDGGSGVSTCQNSFTVIKSQAALQLI
ncbi:MAG: hypothetical protein VX633_01530 [Verrucomicrobiota bacterium]|nr:hypothetical protein [Verrucomicrobiota bacterium]